MGKKRQENPIKILTERLQPSLSEVERKYLSASELGDESQVRDIIENKGANPDTEDSQGRTALDLAVVSDHEGIVHYLFGRLSPEKIQQGLLSAIESGREELCKILLQHPIYQSKRRTQGNENLNLSKTNENDCVIDDEESYVCNQTTYANVACNEVVDDPGSHRKQVQKRLKEALTRASIKNNFQIVQMIMLKGVRLAIPHDYFCACSVCVSDREGDYMMFINDRLDQFRALAGPAYLSLTEENPILACFQLSKIFSRLEIIESENQKTYQELNEQCQEFTLNLLDQCRSSDEVKTILNHSGDILDEQVEFDPEDVYPLLTLAMDMEQKRFVAHSKIQAQVSEQWFSGLQKLRYLNRFEYFMLALPLGAILLPVLSIIYIVAPWSKVSTLLNTPLMRFLNFCCSFITFLVLAVTCKLQLPDTWMMIGCDQTPAYVIALMVLIFMWMLGFLWEEVKQVYSSGAMKYFLSMYNVIDSLMLAFLFSSFSLAVAIPLRLRTIIKRQGLSLHPNQTGTGYGFNLSSMPLCYSSESLGVDTSTFSCSESVTLVLYASWQPEWVPDPEFLSDVMFSLGIILSIFRISFIMPANETLGTMLVSFYQTTKDLIKLMGMFLLIMLSFTCGLAALYAAHNCQTTRFNGVSKTLFVLLWTLLGFGPDDAPELNEDAPLTSITHNSQRNEYIILLAYIFYGIYVFAALVVLMNLLIAVMSNTFQVIQDEKDIEWKFSRTELWISFIEHGSCVAPPFNVIPTPRDVCVLLREIFEKLKSLCHWCLKCKKQSLNNIHFDSTSPRINLKKQDVMSTLIRRYIEHAHKEKEEEDDDASDDKLRRQIEMVASKLDERIDELQVQLQQVDGHVHGVQRSGKDIQTTQKTEIDTTQQLIASHEEYKSLVKKIWEDSKKFRDTKLRKINEMEEAWKDFMEKMDKAKAEEIRLEILKSLEDADFIPRTVLN